MYRLFLTIFLWFWLTAWGILAIVFLGSRLTGMRQVSPPNMFATVAPILAAQAVKAYESGGPQAFARFSQSNDGSRTRQLFLLDGFYKDVSINSLVQPTLEIDEGIVGPQSLCEFFPSDNRSGALQQ
jgi:hypothetical protein